MELSLPLLMAAMTLVGAGFTMRHTRLGRTGVMVLLALGAGFALYFVRNLAQILGENGQIPDPPRGLGARRGGPPAARRAHPAPGGRLMPRRLLAALASLALLAPLAGGGAGPRHAAGRPGRGHRPDGAIVAEGNVEVFYRGVRLTAPRVRYERAGERLFIEGPITLADGDTVTVLADAAELDADLRNGILLGAQMVLDQELQLAAPRIDRVEGRYVQLPNAVATSCRVCASNPTPLWEIRARPRHPRPGDAADLLRGRAVPPRRGARRLSAALPDARPHGRTRLAASCPAIVNSSLLAQGIQTPYFLTFGDHADLLLTPWVSDVTTTRSRRATASASASAAST
jgi:hypothetical protein